MRNHRKLAVLLVALSFAVLTSPIPAVAQGVKTKVVHVILDNWNKGGCHFTDRVRFRFSSTHNVGLARTWIKWPRGVASVPFDLRSGNTLVLSGEFTRSGCDSYQQTWCEGVNNWNARLPPGHYVLLIGMKRVCANSGSKNNGYLSLYEADQPIGTSEQQTSKPDYTVTDGLNVNDLIRDINNIIGQ